MNRSQKDFLNDFEEYLSVVKNFSKHTVMAYISDVSVFLLWLSDFDFLRLTNQKFGEFLRFMQNINYKSSTIARKVASIRAFYNFLCFKDLLELNPIDNAVVPKRPKNLPNFLTEEEIDSILRNIKIESPSGYRNRLILELLWVSGMRISELSSLNYENLNLPENEITVTGKGNKERIVLIPDKTKHFLVNYIENVVDMICKNEKKSNSPLFINKNGYRLQNQSVRKALKEIVSKIDLPKHVTPHVFRHSFATKMLEKGADLRIVQELLGHASISNTQIYTHVSMQKIQNVYNMAHPRA